MHLRMDNKILLTELAAMLKVKKVDTARQWCLKKGIPIFDKNSHRWVLAEDVAIELDRQLIAYLIDKYGKEHGKKVYTMYRNNDVEGLIELKFSSKIDMIRPRHSDYKPKSDTSAKFLNEIQ